MIMSGSAMAWEDLVVPLTQSKQGATLTPDFDFTRVGYLFPQNDASEILYLIVQMPHSWKQESDIYPHVHWMQGGSPIPTFKISYKWDNIGATTSASFQTYTMNSAVSSYTSGSKHQLNRNPVPISGSGKTTSSIMTIKLYREDNVYIGDVLTYQFDIHYRKNSLGSKIEL